MKFLRTKKDGFVFAFNEFAAANPDGLFEVIEVADGVDPQDPKFIGEPAQVEVAEETLDPLKSKSTGN
jgi:hypothetical protein